MFAVVVAWVVAVLHVVFGASEAFGWARMGARFGLTPDAIEHTRSLAANQGAYNFGLAAVLAWALATGQTRTVIAMLVYVVAMAVVGALTVRWTIFVIQGVPALLALALFALL